MLINNISIKNFRCYYGESEISFNKDGKITLIYGDSGYGKSSFLQFFRWMFYNDPDFGKNDDKPLFNVSVFNECSPGEIFSVKGHINFEHLGVRYALTKVVNYKAAINTTNTRIDSEDLVLKSLTNDNWDIIKGDINNKINTILPRGLSKYFLLDGERARDIVLNSKELILAIHSLFGLDAYANALYHIGNPNKKTSVIGHYNRLKLAKMTTVSSINKLTPSEMQSTIQELYEDIEDLKKKRRNLVDNINELSVRNDEILKSLGEANNRGSINQLIKMNHDAIKTNEDNIIRIKKKIGDLFYKNYPYLFLSRMASLSSSILREKNNDFAKNNYNVFEHLKKELLKEIKDKDLCVCGRTLDEDSIKQIDDIIACMPPDSYTYQFGQFVKKAKQQIRSSETNVFDYESLLDDIAECENKIAEFELSNRESMNSLKRLDNAKILVDEFDDNKKQLVQFGKMRSDLEGKIAQKKQVFTISKSQLEKMLKNETVSSEYNDRLAFLEQLKKLLVLENANRELVVRTTLNSCVREIYKKLTTQTELDPDKIQFINNDFSLRTTFLTGGQLAIDVYSYVIGIIKSLQECNMENNENPIIIDAPFAFTGTEQSEHVFKTLPTVSKQTILLTLDLNKIKSMLVNKEIYDFYVIKNESQEKATLEKGEINDIKF